MFHPDQKRLRVMNGSKPSPFPIHPEAVLKWPTTWIEIKVSRIEVMQSLKPPACSSGCSLFDVPLLLFHPNWFLCDVGSVCERTGSESTSWVYLIWKLGNLLNSKVNVEVKATWWLQINSPGCFSHTVWRGASRCWSGGTSRQFLLLFCRVTEVKCNLCKSLAWDFLSSSPKHTNTLLLIHDLTQFSGVKMNPRCSFVWMNELNSVVFRMSKWQNVTWNAKLLFFPLLPAVQWVPLLCCEIYKLWL